MNYPTDENLNIFNENNILKSNDDSSHDKNYNAFQAKYDYGVKKTFFRRVEHDKE